MTQIQFVGITPEQLKEAISQDIKNQIQELKKSISPKIPTEYLSRKGTAELLKINLSTLYNWTKEGKLQSYGMQGRVYYKRDEVESALIAL